MKKWSRKKKFFFGLAVLFLSLQFLQPQRNNGIVMGPMELRQVVTVPDTAFSLLKAACFDCHSNRTVYPWYAAISPVNWWLAFHVEEGKLEVNFSRFGEYPQKRQSETLEAVAETIKTGEMPLASYRLLHPEAKLTGGQKRMLIDWATKSRIYIDQR